MGMNMAQSDGKQTSRPAETPTVEANGSGRRTRTHARIACTLCRKRKVRCNAAIHGLPCTNCKLDGVDCVIGPRKRRVPAVTQLNDAQYPHPFTVNDSNGHGAKRPDFGGTENSSTVSKPSTTDPNGGLQQIPRTLTDHDVEDVIFSYYRFLTPDTVHLLEYSQVKYLESQQCFRIPSKTCLDHFIQAYYDNIHPYQPLLNWDDFMRSYEGESAMAPSLFSLFVFQAMLFASSSFVPVSILQRLGFQDHTTARSAFYDRAKALHDVDCARDALATAQGALLLSYYHCHSDPTVNTYWMARAIFHARSLSAHKLGEGIITTEFGRKLCRLWDCCVVRDRVLAIGLRRSLQIDAAETKSFATSARLRRSSHGVLADCDQDGHTTRVFSALYDLSITFVDIIRMVRPDSAPRNTDVVSVQSCSKRLDDWLVATRILLPDHENQSGPAAVQRNVIYIYYFATRLLLWSYALSESLANQCPLHNDAEEEHKEVVGAIRSIDKCLADINQSGRISYVPLSIAAFIAPALIWHLLSAKFDNGVVPDGSRESLSHYLSFLTMLEQRYGGLESILGYIRRIINSANTATSPKSSPFSPQDFFSGEQLTNLSQIDRRSSHFSRSYIHGIVTIKHAFTLGKYPETHELPPSLASPDSGVEDVCCCSNSNSGWDLPVLEGTSDLLLNSLHLEAEDADADEEASMSSESLTPMLSPVGFDDLLSFVNDVECYL